MMTKKTNNGDGNHGINDENHLGWGGRFPGGLHLGHISQVPRGRTHLDDVFFQKKRLKDDDEKDQ